MTHRGARPWLIELDEVLDLSEKDLQKMRDILTPKVDDWRELAKTPRAHWRARWYGYAAVVSLGRMRVTLGPAWKPVWMAPTYEQPLVDGATAVLDLVASWDHDPTAEDWAAALPHWVDDED